MAKAGANRKTEKPLNAETFPMVCFRSSETIAMETITTTTTTTTTITAPSGQTRTITDNRNETTFTKTTTKSEETILPPKSTPASSSSKQTVAKKATITQAAGTQSEKPPIASKPSAAKIKAKLSKPADDKPPPPPPLSTLPDLDPSPVSAGTVPVSRGAGSTSSVKADSVDILVPAEKYQKPTVGDHLSCAMSHMNDLLQEIKLMKYHLPLQRDTIVTKMRDGVVLCSMALRIDRKSLNEAQIFDPLAPNNKIIQTEDKLESNRRVGMHTLQALGVWPQKLPIDVIGQPVALLGILVKFAETCLMRNISPAVNPNLVFLLDDPSNETQMKLLREKSDEEILLTWVNRQLKGSKLKLENFHTSIADIKVIATLFNNIAPKDKKVLPVAKILMKKDNKSKADAVMRNMQILGLNDILKPSYILHAAEGNSSNFESLSLKHFNTLACAAAFNKYPNYGTVIEEYKESVKKIKSLCRQGATEETLIKWLNSFGLKNPVRFMDIDLRSGISLLSVWDRVSPGLVDWTKVDTKEPPKLKRPFVYTSNCQQVMECMRKSKLYVNCDANDIASGNVKNTCALVFVMMLHFAKLRYREKTGSTRCPTDNDLLAWMRNVMKKSGNEITLSSLKDPKIFNTTLIGVLSERAISQVNRKQSIDLSNLTFPQVLPLSNDNERQSFSITLLHYLRSQDVELQITEFNSKLEPQVLRDLLFQLKAINEAGSKDSIDG